MVNRTFEEVVDLLPAIGDFEGGYSVLEFVCDFYNLEDLRLYFEEEHRKWENDEDDELTEDLSVKEREMFKRIKLINPKQWRVLKAAFKKMNS